MYLHHIIGFSSKALRIFSSKSAINKIAYRGANFVPIAVPRTCLKVFSSNSKMLFFSTISGSSIRVLNLYFSLNYSPSKTIKKQFLFHLKSSCYSGDIQIFVFLFFSLSATALELDPRLISKFMTSSTV